MNAAPFRKPTECWVKRSIIPPAWCRTAAVNVLISYHRQILAPGLEQRNAAAIQPPHPDRSRQNSVCSTPSRQKNGVSSRKNSPLEFHATANLRSLSFHLNRIGAGCNVYRNVKPPWPSSRTSWPVPQPGTHRSGRSNPGARPRNPPCPASSPFVPRHVALITGSQ